MREHGSLRGWEEIIRDKPNSFDGGVSGKVMTHGQGYSGDLEINHIFIRAREDNQEKKITSLGESGSRGCEGGMTLVSRSGVCGTPLAIEGATGTCNSVGCMDMGGHDMVLVRTEGYSDSRGWESGGKWAHGLVSRINEGR